MASVCSGSYLLASAGVLEDKRATTHWSLARDFGRRFPGVALDDDSIYVRDGDVWTSTGISAGIDLALALIRTDLGESVARETARELVVYYRRPGGQSQFSGLLELGRGGGRFDELLDEIRHRLDPPHKVEDLARRAHMSPRHFSRTFTAEVGLTPARAVERLRADAARSALESSAQSLFEVAQDSGFGHPERMRRAFIRLYGRPPSAFRRGSKTPTR